MSERNRDGGNRDAPRVDAEYGERGTGGQEGTGPRRVGDVREERESGHGRGASDTDRDTDRDTGRDHDRDANRDRDRSPDRGTSWVSVVFGWLAALGAGLILSGIVGAVVGGILGALGVQGGTEGGIAGLVGLLLTLFLAFLIGGYVAGRLASRSGLKHGILVPVLSLLVILLLAIVGAIVGSSFIDQLSGVALPQVPGNVQSQVPQQGLGTILTISGILALLVPFVGGALGGLWGGKTGQNRP